MTRTPDADVRTLVIFYQSTLHCERFDDKFHYGFAALTISKTIPHQLLGLSSITVNIRTEYIRNMYKKKTGFILFCHTKLNINVASAFNIT